MSRCAVLAFFAPGLLALRAVRAILPARPPAPSAAQVLGLVEPVVYNTGGDRLTVGPAVVLFCCAFWLAAAGGVLEYVLWRLP